MELDGESHSLARGIKEKISLADQNSSIGFPRVTCFSEEAHDATLHFQIISFSNQVYIWIGCNSAKLGQLHAGAFTKPNMTPTVASLIGGGADNTGAGITRRLVSRTGLNIILACNIPKNSPMLETLAERLLTQKLNSLGYSKVDKK